MEKIYKQRYKSFEEKVIPNNKILSWTKEDINCYGDTTHNLYSINYLDENFNLKQIVFRNGNYRTLKETLISELLEITSGMKKNDKREKNYTDKLIYERIKDMNKRLAVIKLLIKNKDQQESDCLNVNETKYPDLIKEYKNLSRAIRPLRKKLDLPFNDDFKRICGEPKGSRPLWMEEKIKGCYKYPSKKQRDYCINVYSPYGKE